MPAITRRQCGCNCSNRAEWAPEGDAVPDVSCSACSGSPCEYLAIFDHCEYECNGLSNTIDPLGSNGVISLPKDVCFHEDVCRYSYKDSTEDLSDFVIARRAALLVGTAGECTYRNASGSLPYWAAFFRNIGSLLNTVAGLVGMVPIFGCSSRTYNGSIDQPCGWGDFAGITCDNLQEWVDFLDSAFTFNRWTLDIQGTTANLYGWDDNVEQPIDPATTPSIKYTTDSWECPDPEADPPVRNTLRLESYPDSMDDCRKFPKAVCIVPGYTNFQTPCDTAADMQACCDSGADEVCLDVDVLDCSGGDTTTVSVVGVRNASLPTGVSNPSGKCGYFWGTASVDCTTSGKTGSFTFGLLVWCDGSDWQVSQYCYESSPYGSGWTEVCTTTATLTDCCPIFRITFYCDGTTGCCCTPDTGTIDTDCCPDDLIPETLTAELSPGTDCPGFDQSGTLTYGTSGSPPTLEEFWLGTVTDCSTTLNYKLRCQSGAWEMKAWDSGSGNCGPTTEGTATWKAADSASCDPLELVFTFTGASLSCACCTAPGSYVVTVTG